MGFINIPMHLNDLPMFYMSSPFMLIIILKFMPSIHFSLDTCWYACLNDTYVSANNAGPD